ncbi:hypothetical protein H0N98_00755 [Candidatus Micrarchaeota archaeon]|nr:hypothetical protein [Candidatus Micrarchaeota archaeon]
MKAYLKGKGLPEDKFVEKLPLVKEFGREPASEVFHRHKAEISEQRMKEGLEKIKPKAESIPVE